MQLEAKPVIAVQVGAGADWVVKVKSAEEVRLPAASFEVTR